jgi:DNA polymerase theta
MKQSNDDIFRQIAAKWNKIEETMVTEVQRNQTKSLCYGVIYGMGTKALAEKMDVEEVEAKKLIEEFHNTYPTIRKFTEKIVQRTKELGFIETVTCRRRYLPEINSEHSSESSKAERQALNSTIQGSASDLVKNAILKMEKNLRKSFFTDSDCKLVLHLHDELFYEVDQSKYQHVVKILIKSMENCVVLRVPLRVKVKVGSNWGEMREVTSDGI